MEYILQHRSIKLNDEYEVIVVGGGPSGCAAAIAAARRGAKTLLIEATGCLGGMGTMGLLPAWCPFTDQEKIIYRGIAEEIFNASKTGIEHVKKEDTDWVPIDPERLKTVYDEYVVESGASILFHTVLSAVDSENGIAKAIIVSNKAGLTAYKAKVYIDCTGDGDLAAWAGAEIINASSDDDFQPATHCFEISNVNMKKYHKAESLYAGNPNSPIHDIVRSGKYHIPDTHICNNEVYPGTIGFNAGHIWHVDGTDPKTVSDAMIKGRKMAHEIHRALVDYQPKTFSHSKVTNTAPLMGIRESRRIMGDYILTKEDYLERRTFEDEICRNSYYIDVHHSADEAAQINEGQINIDQRGLKYRKGESHGVPYRCLTPKGLKNVLVAGRCISTDRAVQGSIRVMPVCLCTGEAAGKAAVIAKEMDVVDVHKVDTDLLRNQIAEDGGYIL